MKQENEDFAFLVKKDQTIAAIPALITYAEVPDDVDFDVDDLITDLPVSK